MQHVMQSVVAMLLLAAACATASDVPRQDLFVAGATGHGITYPCFRQPALLAADANGTVLVAFAEGRNVSSASCAPQLHQDRRSSPPPASNEIGGLVQRRSTDSGATWSEPETLYSGNLDFYTVVRDAATSKLWLMLQEGSAVQVFTSSDVGATWQGPHLLNVSVPAPFSASVKPAVGHGMQIEDRLCGSGSCAHGGRLIMPFVCMNASASTSARVRTPVRGDAGACAACHACLLLSDDHGASWSFGGFGQAGSRESQAVQVPTTASSAELFVTERNFGPTPGYRMYARSNDGGATLGSYGIDKTITSPVTAHWTGIVASVQRLAYATGSAPDRLALSIPGAADVRGNLTLRVSADGGHTWGRAKTFWPGLGGYTDMARVGDNALGIIYENGDATFADRISFSLFPASWFNEL